MQHKSLGKDVFVSYRRDGGGTAAALLTGVLKSKNITVFFDKETLGAGDFSEAIHNHIASAQNVVFVVSPGVFDRCVNESDWVRIELEKAHELKKKIIPVFVNGVTGFPNKLPPSIEWIANLNAFNLNIDSYEAQIKSLIDEITTRLDFFYDAYENYFSLETHQEVFEQFVEFIEGDADAVKDFSKYFISKLRKKGPEAVKKLMKRLTLTALKDVARDELEIDYFGGYRKVSENILNWVSGQQVQPPGLPDDDKFEHFLDAIIKGYGDTSYLKAVLKENQGDWEVTGRGAKDYLREHINQQEGIEDIFQIKSDGKKIFGESQIKEIALHLIGEYSGRRGSLIDTLVEYAEYEYVSAEQSA